MLRSLSYVSSKNSTCCAVCEWPLVGETKRDLIVMPSIKQYWVLWYCDIKRPHKRFSKATVEIIFTDQIFLADRHQWCSRDEKAGASTLPAEERLPNSRPPHATQKKPHDTLHAWLWRKIVSDALKDVQQPPFRGNRRRDVGRKARIMLAPHCPSYPQSESRCNKARLQSGDQKLLKSTLFEIQIIYLFQLFRTK